MPNDAELKQAYAESLMALRDAVSAGSVISARWQESHLPEDLLALESNQELLNSLFERLATRRDALVLAGLLPPPCRD